MAHNILQALNLEIGYKNLKAAFDMHHKHKTIFSLLLPRYITKTSNSISFPSALNTIQYYLYHIQITRL